MTRLSALIWFMLVLAAGFATFKVKYAVQDIDDQLTRARKQTVAEQEEIRVLTAEWTYLTQPERLADLNRRFFALQPITAKQLEHGIAEIPMRAPPPSPDVVVAASRTPAAQQTAANPLPVTAATFSTPSVQPAPIQPAPILSAPIQPAPILSAPVQPASVQPAPVQLAKANPAATPGSLDALIARIAEAR